MAPEKGNHLYVVHPHRRPSTRYMVSTNWSHRFMPTLPDSPQELTEHAFFTCPATKATWRNYNDLRLRFNQPQVEEMEEDILLGFWTIKEAEDSKWTFTSNCEVNRNTPWDLLRCNLLWQIWCQRCAKVRKGKKFHLRTAIFKAWRTTIHTGIAAWNNIWENRNRVSVQITIF
jgi:hypothetical protein